MKKVLFTATVDSHILHFHIPYLKLFKDNGYEVHVATNGDEEIPYCDVKHKISFERSPVKINNLKAIKNLKKVIDKEEYEIIHCHTPMGSVVTRLAAKKARKKGTRVIYTAHGFHFYKGAPKKFWAIFYPIEKILSKFTDTLITINKEDYELAKAKFYCDVEYIPGVGISKEKFDIDMTEEEKDTLRQEIGITKEDFVMIYPAEISDRKNQKWLIKSLESLIKKYSNIHLLLPGSDSLNGEINRLIEESDLKNNVHLLGYRKDIPNLLKISNLAISSSRQEGLPVNIMESMYVGLPIIATDCRGNRDLIKDGENGYIIPQGNSEKLNEQIYKVYNNEIDIFNMKEQSKQMAEEYLLENIVHLYEDIYKIQENKSVKKKILHLLASNIFSGAENVVCTIIDNFKNEYEMTYCSPIGIIKPILEKKEIKYYGIDKFSLKEIKKIVKEYNPDIIHAHDYKASVFATISGFKGKIISHIHNNCADARKWNIKTVLYSIVANKFYKVLGVSDEVFNEAIYRNKIVEKYVTIPNYVDKEKIILKSNEYSFDKNYDIFYIGRLVKEKNPIYYIEIINEMRKKYPTITAVMIGDGEQREECQELVKKYNLQQNIEILGFRENPFPVIKNCKIGIMPSIWEGFGLTAIESMILNKPVLNSGAGGLSQIFDKHKEFICESIDDYIERYQKIINNEIAIDLDMVDNYTNKSEWKNKINEIYFD